MWDALDSLWTVLALVVLSGVFGFISTFQFRLVFRVAALATSIALLCAGIYFVGDWHTDGGFLVLARNAVDAENPLVLQLFEANKPMVEGYLGQFSVLLVAIAAAMCALALIAFLPGKRFDAFVRYLIGGLAGMALGGIVAFVLVSLGIGTFQQRQAFLLTFPSEEDWRAELAECKSDDRRIGISDADSFTFGDTHFRWSGIDAPEFRCIADKNSNSERTQFGYSATGEKVYVGEEAYDAIISLLAGRTQFCKRFDKEKYGRALVDCDPVDSSLNSISDDLLQMGLAVPDEAQKAGQPYCPQTEQGIPPEGMNRLCMLWPAVWRKDAKHSDARNLFKADDWKWRRDEVVCPANCPADREIQETSAE